MTPSASYTFSPETNGRPRQQSLGLGLRTAVDIKLARRDTSATGEEELQKVSGIVIWNLGTRYTPDAPRSKAWSNITSTFNTNISGANISINHNIDPYRMDIVNTSATAGFRIGGTHPFGHSSQVVVRELNAVAAADSADSTGTTTQEFASGGVQFVQTGESGEERPAGGSLGMEEGRLPWSLSIGFTYNKGNFGGVSSTARLGWDIKLTDNWQINYSTIYDVERRELNGQNFSISRNLHCWAMTFARQQLGDEWQYYFRITLNAHPDLYGESGSRGLGSGLTGQFSSTRRRR
jgi:hypothetical protein